MKALVKPRTLAVLACGLALAACGKAEKKEEKVEAKQYIVVSAVDCADNTGLDYDTCSTVLEKAIGQHDKSATVHSRNDACEKAEGVDRCERVGEKSYRVRLTAFQITMSDKPTAIPLYAGKSDKPGLRTASDTSISPDTDSFIFTKSAEDAAHMHAGSKKKS